MAQKTCWQGHSVPDGHVFCPVCGAGTSESDATAVDGTPTTTLQPSPPAAGSATGGGPGPTASGPVAPGPGPTTSGPIAGPPASGPGRSGRQATAPFRPAPPSQAAAVRPRPRLTQRLAILVGLGIAAALGLTLVLLLGGSHASKRPSDNGANTAAASTATGNPGAGSSRAGNTVGTAATSVTSSTVTSPPTTGPPPTPPPTALVTAADPGAPDAAAVQQTLAAYFGAINGHNWDGAWATFTPRQQAALPPSQIASGAGSSQDAGVVVGAVTAQPNGSVVAAVTFQSTQAPADSPDRKPCNRWSLDYTMQPGANGLLIDSVQPTSSTPYGDCP